MRNIKKRKAFTFIELMIVVSMIAVIASFLLPALLKAEPNEIAINYKKGFYSIERAISNLINDTQIYPDFAHNGGNRKYGDLRYTNDPEIIDGEEEITRYQLDATGEYFCENLAKILNTIGQINCTNAALISLNNQNMTAATTNFMLTNGVSIGGIFTNEGNWQTLNDDGTVADVPFMTLCIDINGNDGIDNNDNNPGGDGPNRGCAIADRAVLKRDQFRIRINAEGKVYTDSSVGNNNFYMENKMLLNPRAVTVDEPLNATERAEVVKTTATAIDPPDCNPALGYVPVDGGNACLYTGGYSEIELRRERVSN